jgi:hypothetical protein
MRKRMKAETSDLKVETGKSKNGKPGALSQILQVSVFGF